MDPLSAEGVAVDAESLLRLRHLVRHSPERRLAPTGRPGGFAGKRRGSGLETVDVRVFSDGDDLRHVDRNATARTGVAHVRTFREEREKVALLVADFRPSMLWGTRRALRSVAAAEALAIAGWRAIEAGGQVGLVALGAGESAFVAPRGRERGMATVVGAMAAAHRAALDGVASGRNLADPPLDAALDVALSLRLKQGSVILATGLDAPGAEFDSLALALHRRMSLTVLLMMDAFEVNAPAGAYPFMSGEGGPRWALVAASRNKTAAPDPRLARLGRLGVPCIAIDAGQDQEAMARRLEELDGYAR